MTTLGKCLKKALQDAIAKQKGACVYYSPGLDKIDIHGFKDEWYTSFGPCDECNNGQCIRPYKFYYVGEL